MDETKTYKLWIDNDEGLYKAIKEQVEVIMGTSKIKNKKVTIRDFLKNCVESELNINNEMGLKCDLLLSAIDNINFYGLAVELIAEYKENLKYKDTQ